MINTFGRVRNINTTKNYVFIGLQTPNKNGYKQLLVDTQDKLNISTIKLLKNNDLIYFCAEEIMNHKGLPIYKLDNIIKIVPSLLSDLPNYNRMGIKTKNFIDALNGKEQLRILNVHDNVIKYLRNYFDSRGYKEVVGNILESTPTSSYTPFFETHSQNGSDLFLRVTTENSLKQTTALTLESTYSLQPVFHNKKKTYTASPQVLTLEYGSLNSSDQEFINFIKNYINSVSLFASSENLDIPELPELKVISYDEAIKIIPDFGLHHLEKIELNKNLIVYDVPANSPFIKKVDGKCVEIQWYINGQFVAHAYQDETNYDKICIAAKEQALSQGLSNYNHMEYFNMAVPDTYSCGLGIEKSLMYILGLNNLISVQNPLGLDAIDDEYGRKRIKR